MAGVRQFDEDKVLEVALEVFWRQGVAATSMPDLAEATGVRRGSLYNAYGGKEAIFLLAYERYAERFLAPLRQSLAADDPAKALSGFFRAAIDNMTMGSPAWGCLTTKTATDGSAESALVRQRLQGLLDAIAAMVEEALGRDDWRGRLALSPRAAADVIVTFTRGLAVMERVHGDRARLEATADALVRALVRDGKGS